MSTKDRTPHKPIFRKIKMRPQKEEMASAIAAKHGIDGITGKVLAARGFEAGDKLGAFLNPTLREGLPEPFGLKNLEEACAMIAAVVKRSGKIAVCSDFDVDGLSGSSQVTHFLRRVGAGVEVFVPDRFADGYGLNEKMIRQAKERGCELVLTIDFGTTNVKELELARELGLKTIVLDHHHVSDKGPPADIFINPQQPGCGFADGTMCASGLSWYLILGLREFIPGAKDIDTRTYLELACLGTICDMVPLIGVNRVIARRGLERIGTSEWAGINALKEIAGIKKRMNCSDISFGLGPRLNAAGRLEHGEIVVELLTTTDPRRALKIAHELDKLNTERQDTEATAGCCRI